LEEAKSLPWAAVYDYYCSTKGITPAEDYISDIQEYERNVTSKR
jgi:L-rhamnose isomerase